MDRNALVKCAAALLTASAPMLCAGCNRADSASSAASAAAPAVLSELGHTAARARRLPSPAKGHVATLAIDREPVLVPALDAASDSPVALDDTDEAQLPLANHSDESDPANESTLDWAKPFSEVTERIEVPREIATDIAPAESQPSEPEVQAPLQSPLPWANADPHHPEMAAMIRRADERVRRGFQLAQRGALYSARSEYLAALQLVAQANDAQSGSQFFSQSLATGLTAVKEASDFTRQNPKKPVTDTAAIIKRHRTRLISSTADAQLTPMAASQRYYTFAQEQLAAAAAREITGSMALFGLGKAALDPAGNRSAAQLERTAQAMTYYQAALMADPQNYRAANELGVLAADNGNLARARELFMASLALSPQPTIWRNLAIVHARQGQIELAQNAERQAVSLERTGAHAPDARVQWLDPAAFAQTVPLSDSLLPPASAPKSPAAGAATDATAAGSAAPDQKAPVSTARRPLSAWLPWNTLR